MQIVKQQRNGSLPGDKETFMGKQLVSVLRLDGDVTQLAQLFEGEFNMVTRRRALPKYFSVTVPDMKRRFL